MTTTNPWIKTVCFAAVATAAAGLLVITRPSASPLTTQSDQGAPLTPDLADPQSVASLEVIGWDEQQARPRAFKVAFEGNRWVVPSAYNYPVDATQNMAAAASSFVGTIKDRVVTDLPAEHARLGVIAPDDLASTATSGRGTRVTMRDKAGRVLADLVIGLAVPAEAGAPSDKRYVREAGKNRVYVTRLNQAYSTRFADWVQSDLLSVTSDQVQRVSVDRYRVDEQRGTLLDLKTVTLTRATPPTPPSADPSQPPAGVQGWTLESSEGPLAAGVALNQAKADETIAAISALKIVGVRPKPANLAQVLGGSGSAGVQLSPADQMSLQRHGFYITSGGLLVANEGGMSVQCSDGVVYTLWFGELATDESTKDQAAGTEAATAKAPDGRYLMVTVAFDDKVLGTAPAKPTELLDLEAKAAAATAEAPLPPDQQARLTNLLAEHKAKADAFEAKAKAGRERQEKLAKRFSGWYYVVDAASLAKIRPSREDLTTPLQPVQPPVVIPTPPAGEGTLQPGR